MYFLGTLCFSSGEFPHVPLFFFLVLFLHCFAFLVGVFFVLSFNLGFARLPT